jgi:hypothetical protein
VDCASFAVMRKLGIADVFAYDKHFSEQGFIRHPKEAFSKTSRWRQGTAALPCVSRVLVGPQSSAALSQRGFEKASTE